jgi:hypothetical protein
MAANTWTRRKSSACSATTWPDPVRITRFPSISEQQFLGCAAAFVDSISGELNAAGLALRRLEGQGKGRAFAYEMTLDTHRYGALIVLDRWTALVQAFGPHLALQEAPGIVTGAPVRVQAAEKILGHANQLLDNAETYSGELAEACLLAFREVDRTFAEERAVTERYGTLGPMLSADYREARRIFLEDLAAR